MEWMLARDWFHSASRLGSADARRVLIFQKKLYDDPDCVGRGLNFEHLEGVKDRRRSGAVQRKDIGADARNRTEDSTGAVRRCRL